MVFVLNMGLVKIQQICDRWQQFCLEQYQIRFDIKWGSYFH